MTKAWAAIPMATSCCTPSPTRCSGAIAAPDIGALFPPSDAKWKGADSAIFLREALKRVREAGYRVSNIDASLILAAPKIGPHPL